VMPPSTGFGIASKAPEILPKTPKRMRKTQHQRPAARLAQRVTAITPLFYSTNLTRIAGTEGGDVRT
jgi:hypothetical protein